MAKIYVSGSIVVQRILELVRPHVSVRNVLRGGGCPLLGGGCIFGFGGPYRYQWEGIDSDLYPYLESYIWGKGLCGRD